MVQVHSTWEEEDEVDGVEATVEFHVSAGDTSLKLTQAFEQYGNIPLPPYMRREVNEEDKELYQTVFAQSEGSVAAPTAGLHFTDELISELQTKGLKFSHVNLHVSAGTFRPIAVENIANHDMHEEQFSVEKRTIRDLVCRHTTRNEASIVYQMSLASFFVHSEALFASDCFVGTKSSPRPSVGSCGDNIGACAGVVVLAWSARVF